MNIMYTHACLPLTTKPMRATDNCATLIDHIWTSNTLDNIHNFIIYTDITDHFPVCSCLHKNSVQRPSSINKRVFSEANINTFKRQIADANWMHILEMNDPLEAFDEFFSIYCDIFQKCFPKCTVKIMNKHDKSPHITPRLQNSIREKRRLERLASKWPLSYGQRYRTYRNKLVTVTGR